MIHLRHVTVKRQNRLLLDDLSLDIEEGQHVAIIGPNGAGKSTLVRVITKDIHPIQSEDMEMTIYGKRLWNVFDLRTRLGIVSDRLAELCNTSFKAEEIVISGFFSSIGISFSHTVTDSMRERSKAMMEFMEVYHLANKPMNRLSSGETKRILIARALVHDPSTLILDEPASNLDLKTQRTFKESIRSIAKQGRNILLVTHDLANIIPEIDHVIILKEGKLYMQGDKKRLLKQDILSDVYETNVYVDHHDGWYKAWC